MSGSVLVGLLHHGKSPERVPNTKGKSSELTEKKKKRKNCLIFVCMCVRFFVVGLLNESALKFTHKNCADMPFGINGELRSRQWDITQCHLVKLLSFQNRHV